MLSIGFLSYLLYHYSISPAYLFTTNSAFVSSGSGASWEDYILQHLSYRFTSYALRLTDILKSALRLGQRLQTASPLNSPLIIPDLPDDFVKDDIDIATHLSHYVTLCHIRLIKVEISNVIDRLFILSSVLLQHKSSITFYHKLCACIVR